jgi:hypothetical protein
VQAANRPALSLRIGLLLPAHGDRGAHEGPPY